MLSKGLRPGHPSGHGGGAGFLVTRQTQSKQRKEGRGGRRKGRGRELGQARCGGASFPQLLSRLRRRDSPGRVATSPSLSLGPAPVPLRPAPVSGTSFQRTHGKSRGTKSPVAVGPPQQDTVSCIPTATSPWPRATVHVEGRGHLPSGCAAHEMERETLALPIAGRAGEAQVQGKIRLQREGRGCEN